LSNEKGETIYCSGYFNFIFSFRLCRKNFVPAKSKPIPVFNVPLGLYLGGGLTYADSECECPPLLGADGTIVNKSESKTYGFNLKAGYNLNKYMSFEAKYLYTPWGDEDRL